jgi:alginate O-acetyltransferase complex protein AlgI
MIISLKFFGVLIGSAFIYWLIPWQKWRNLFLSVVSLAFISWFDKGAGLLVITLTAFTYLFALLIDKKENKAFFHKLGIIGLLGVLVAFKYTGLLVNTFNHLHAFISLLPQFQIDKILLPLGVSYITFKYISYLTDIYWKIVKPGNYIDFLCYGSLFTIYVAGPIERFERLKPQLRKKLIFKTIYIEEAFERIVFGIFKKAVLADWIGYFINPVWEDQSSYTLGIRALALLGFSLQIYFDFSGYSDIAIGASRLFGFKIMENFNWPYIQPNISQFWRNWHISLSDWIRDYLFFPLSRISNKKIWLMFFVPVIAMGLCGFWHGAGWNFLWWGVLHGLAISIYQFWQKFKRKHKWALSVSNKKWFDILSPVMTFVFVTIAWIWFR